MTAASSIPVVSERPLWRAVAVPSEHGGWGLTLEPVVLGLIVAPSVAGAMLGVAALLAFLVRTPLKLALVDRRRGRWLERSRLAARVAAVELATLLALVVAALALAGPGWLIPVAVAAPLVLVELWFDVRSRGRRLLPELCGALGIAAVVAAIAIAGGEATALAGALWLVLAARSLASIPFVRAQIARLRSAGASTQSSDLAQAAALGLAAVAVVLDRAVVLGALALVGVLVAQIIWVRTSPVPPRTLGMRQMAIGFGLALVTAIGVLAS